MDPTGLTNGDIVFLFLIFGFAMTYSATSLYGTYLSFKKGWVTGAVALMVPGFSLIVGLAKVFRKDILK